MSSSTAFNDEKGGSSSVGEPEYGHDPASGGIFSSDYKRYEACDLRGAQGGFICPFGHCAGTRGGAAEGLSLLCLCFC